MRKNKSKMRTIIIILLVIASGFIYIRGIKKAAAADGMNCQIQLIAVVCTAKEKTGHYPSLQEIIKAGINFKN